MAGNFDLRRSGSDDTYEVLWNEALLGYARREDSGLFVGVDGGADCTVPMPANELAKELRRRGRSAPVEERAFIEDDGRGQVEPS